MTEEPAKQEIEELVRRLETTPYSAADIREAGQILVTMQAHALSYKMALQFSDSKFVQVRALGLSMMEAVAPHSDAAKGFLAGAKDAAKLLDNGRMAPIEDKPPVPDYSAIGEVIKMWLRQGRENRGRGSRR
jgi:hypothetical protein